MSPHGEGGQHEAAGAPHAIRLRGPWTLRAGGRVKLPAAWSDALGDADRATLTRSFNRPTNLGDSGVSVRLRVESPQEVVGLLLNGSELADGDDLVGVLAPSNRLAVTVNRRDREAVILEAWLEITEQG